MSSIHVHSERSARTGIAIVWPAWFEGSTDSELHATSLFLGTTDNVDYTKADVERALAIPYLWPGWVKVTGTEMFGRNKDVPVLTLERIKLLAVSRIDTLTRLNRVGIQASSEFSFNPHVTIAKEAGVYEFISTPEEIHLESPVLWWGDERIVHAKHTKVEVAA